MPGECGKCGGLAQYDEGGLVEEALAAGAGGLSLILAAHPRTRHLAKRGVNKMALPLQRALKHPVVATEAVAKQPLSEAQSDELFEQVRGGIDHPFASLPVTKKQGAWMGDEGMQYNPLYEQELPRTMGPLSGDEEALRYAAMLGEGLDQQGVPLMRAMAQPFDIPDDADSLLTNELTGGALRRLAQQLGPEVVVSQQPSSRALVFGLGGQDISALRKQAEDMGIGARYAVSRPGTDRLVVTEGDWGPPNRMRKDILGR